MKTNPVLYAQMEQYYQRYQQSSCRVLLFAKPKGWPMRNSAIGVSAWPRTSRPVGLPNSLCLPLLVLELAGQARLEFYSPVEASFLRALLG